MRTVAEVEKEIDWVATERARLMALPRSSEADVLAVIDYTCVLAELYDEKRTARAGDQDAAHERARIDPDARAGDAKRAPARRRRTAEEHVAALIANESAGAGAVAREALRRFGSAAA